jgi:hypothetical protein
MANRRNGYYAVHQDGDRHWHEAPERDRCGGSGAMRCYCGGDFCVCANFGEIDCMGCEDCDSRYEQDSTPTVETPDNG